MVPGHYSEIIGVYDSLTDSALFHVTLFAPVFLFYHTMKHSMAYYEYDTMIWVYTHTLIHLNKLGLGLVLTYMIVSICI